MPILQQLYQVYFLELIYHSVSPNCVSRPLSFSNDEGDGDENVKKVICFTNKTTTLHLHHAFFIHFVAVTARPQREISLCDVLWRT